MYSGISVGRWMVATFVVGAALRLGLAMVSGIDAPPPLAEMVGRGSDSNEYDTYAWNLASGRGYRGMSPDVTDQNHLTAYRAPATSILWAGLYRVAGHRYSAVRIANSLLGAATVFFIFGIGRLCFGELVGLLSAAAFAVWPISLFYSAQLASEPLFAFLLAGYTYFSLRAAVSQTWNPAIAAGLLLGLALLTRPNAVFMIPLMVVWALRQFPGPKKVLVGLAIPVIALGTLIPWAVRNYIVFHAFVPFSTSGGDVLLGGNNRVVATDPVYYGYWVFPTLALPEYREQIQAPNDEVIRDRVETRLALKWVEDNPRSLWYLTRSKLRRSLTPFLDSGSPRLYVLGTLFSWGPVLVLGSLAFFPTAFNFLRSGHPGWILHLLILHFVLTALVFWGAARFRYPVEGMFIVLACVSALWLMEWFHRIFHSPLRSFPRHKIA